MTSRNKKTGEKEKTMFVRKGTDEKYEYVQCTQVLMKSRGKKAALHVSWFQNCATGVMERLAQALPERSLVIPPAISGRCFCFVGCRSFYPLLKASDSHFPKI